MKRKCGFFGTAFLAVFLLMAVFHMTAGAVAADTYSLYVKGTNYYSRAYELLGYLNEERTSQGLNTLTMDKELLEVAMQRAAECAVDFSHTRPNHTSCFTLSSKMSGENIAAGYSQASSTFQQWMNSPGHKANMLSASYRSIGIGCFSQGGVTYWTQAFSGANGSGGSQPADKAVTVLVDIVEGTQGIRFNLNMAPDYTMTVGNKMTLTPGRVNPGWESVYCAFTADSFVWTSSNPSVAMVDAAGNVTARGVGDAVIKAVPRTGTGEGGAITVSCRNSVENAVISEISPVIYSGSAYTPDFTVTVNGNVLKKGTDYDVTYSNNTNAGTASIRITGKGSYTGSVTARFTIQKANIAEKANYQLKGWNMKGFDDAFDCISAMLSVTYNGKQLECDTDYYICSTSISSASSNVMDFEVMFCGNYSGSRKFINIETGYIKPIAAQTYTGKAIVPGVKVYGDYGAQCLTAGTDYEIQFSNNIKPGTATVTITGTGRYYGTLKDSFKIVNQSKPSGTSAVKSNAITASNIKKVYSTKKQSFSIGAKQLGTGKMTYSSNNKSVTVSASGKVTVKAKFVGAVTITIKAAADGKYKAATKKITVTVNPAAVKISKLTNSKKGKMTVTWKKNSACTGYQIQYSTSSSFSGSKSVTISKKTTASKTISGLKKGKTYYVRIRTYKTVSGKKYYSAWSSKSKLKISK